MIETLDRTQAGVLGFKLSDKLHDADHKHFVPAVEAAVAKYGKVRLRAQFEDFQGWDLHAMWDDIKFATKHCSDLERIAIVGDRKWEEWMVKVCKPFTRARVQYFDRAAIEDAWKWLGEA